MKSHDAWGHPLSGENLVLNPATTAGQWDKRECKHCRICRDRATRAGQTLAQYYAANPKALPYNGFPVAGAKTGRTSGMANL